jgi:hypothetical protein
MRTLGVVLLALGSMGWVVGYAYFMTRDWSR